MAERAAKRVRSALERADGGLAERLDAWVEILVIALLVAEASVLVLSCWQATVGIGKAIMGATYVGITYKGWRSIPNFIVNIGFRVAFIVGVVLYRWSARGWLRSDQRLSRTLRDHGRTTSRR